MRSFALGAAALEAAKQLSPGSYHSCFLPVARGEMKRDGVVTSLARIRDGAGAGTANGRRVGSIATSPDIACTNSEKARAS